MSFKESMKLAAFFIFSRCSGFSFTLYSFATASGLFRNLSLNALSWVAQRSIYLRFFSSLTKIDLP